MKEKVEIALKNLRPLLRGADATVQDIKDGIVTLDIYVSSCGATLTKEMALEILEEELRDMVPEIKNVVLA